MEIDDVLLYCEYLPEENVLKFDFGKYCPVNGFEDPYLKDANVCVICATEWCYILEVGNRLAFVQNKLLDFNKIKSFQVRLIIKADVDTDYTKMNFTQVKTD